MSCEIKRLAKVADLYEVKEFLGFSQDDNWLNAVYYSLSPTAEMLAIGHGALVLLLTSRWDHDFQQNKYIITTTVVLENQNEIITSIICLPIIGENANTQSSAAWTCIAIGLASGLVIFYTDSGEEIFQYQWHNETVQGIKAQSGKKINEELHIMYTSCVCILQGNHLIQLLRTMKKHSRKDKSSKSDNLPIQDSISCRKWGFGGKNIAINDAVIVGAQKTCAFDHLLTASMEGGFYAKYKSAPPQNALVMGIGAKPYIGFHWAKEGFVQPVLADVARAVASKIKSALPTWLTGSQAQTIDVPPPPIPSEPMALRFGLCDIQRTGLSVWLAPGNQFAAVTDNLGRVILVDCNRGIAIRIWKGYREAQCSFVKVNEKLSKNSDRTERRHALFLVIFAPRRSCLEIWGLQRGPKIAAFNASRHGQLIYNSHTLIGVTAGVKVKYTTNNCVFLDPSDQSLKEITIPFHCALNDSNSKAAKDIHLLRRIKSFLRSGDGSKEEIIEEIQTSCRSFQTDEVRLQCVEMLVKNNKVKPDILKVALDVFLNQVKEDIEIDDKSVNAMEVEDVSYVLHQNQLKLICTNYSKLVEFYLYLDEGNCDKQTFEETHNIDDKEKSEPKSQSIEDINLSETELDNLQKLIDLSMLERSSTNPPKVTFHEKVISNLFIDYLSAFICNFNEEISLKDDKSTTFSSIGFSIFRNFMEKGKLLNEFLNKSIDSGISSDDLMKLLLYYWLDKPFLYTKIEDLITDLMRFTSILQQICALASEKIKYEYNSICFWWQNVREMLLESRSALMSLLASMMCRNHALRYRQRENSNDDNSSSTEEDRWEQVSQEAAQWSLLIGKLDDIAVLGAVLSCSKPCEHPILPILHYEKPDVSLKAIVGGGKGIVSELVSKWISSTGIDPNLLLETPVAYEPCNSENIKQNDSSACAEKPPLNYLKILRDHFPFSLQSSILLSHLTWEYICTWSKNMSNLNYLKAALKCLCSIKKSDYALKHGICCMFWNVHLKIPLEATKKIINKTGRLPKEKLCQQDIGLSDSLVPEFLEHCTTFLDNFSSSVINDKMDLRHEELLQDGPLALSLLALQQNLANSEILLLHTQLNKVLFIISSLGIKYPKPIQSLFDAMSNQTFFCEINRSLPYTLPRPDLILQKRRLEFLCITITATMDLIREDTQGIYLNDHILWIQHIEHIANLWELDTAQLKNHQIVELYGYGWDEYAEEQLESVIDTQHLGSLLLKIAGRRLNIYTRNSPTAYAQVASIGPLIMDYLDTLNDSNGPQVHRTSSDISLESLIRLTGKVFQCLSSKETKELRIVGQMFDACATLKENNN